MNLLTQEITVASHVFLLFTSCSVPWGARGSKKQWGCMSPNALSDNGVPFRLRSALKVDMHWGPTKRPLNHICQVCPLSGLVLLGAPGVASCLPYEADFKIKLSRLSLPLSITAMIVMIIVMIIWGCLHRLCSLYTGLSRLVA